MKYEMHLSKEQNYNLLNKNQTFNALTISTLNFPISVVKIVIFLNYATVGESRGHGRNNGTNALGLQERETPHLHPKP